MTFSASEVEPHARKVDDGAPKVFRSPQEVTFSTRKVHGNAPKVDPVAFLKTLDGLKVTFDAVLKTLDAIRWAFMGLPTVFP